MTCMPCISCLCSQNIEKIHIVCIAKLGINIYIHTDSYVGNEGIYIVFAL